MAIGVICVCPYRCVWVHVVCVNVAARGCDIRYLSQWLSILFLSHGLSWNLNPTDCAGISSQGVPGICSFLTLFFHPITVLVGLCPFLSPLQCLLQGWFRGNDFLKFVVKGIFPFFFNCGKSSHCLAGYCNLDWRLLSFGIWVILIFSLIPPRFTWEFSILSRRIALPYWSVRNSLNWAPLF